MEEPKLQDVIQAVRLRFGPSDSSPKLSELLFFLESLQISPSLRERENQGESQQRPKRKGLESSAYAHAIRVPVQLHQPQHQPQVPTAPPRAAETQKQKPRSYADAAKATKGSTSQGPSPSPRKEPKPIYIPDRLKETLSTPKAIRAFFKDPKDLELTPEALLARIASPQQASAIRGLKKLSKRLIQVYPTSLDTAKFLENTEGEWLAQMGGTRAKKPYYITIRNIDPQTDLEALKGPIQAQNQLLGSILAIERLGTSTTVKIGLESLEEANTLIYKGLLLDYEIKKAEKLLPRKKGTPSLERKPIRPKSFFKETTRPIEPSQTSQASQEPLETQDVEMEGEWTQVDSRKRKQPNLEPKRPRGRPRLLDTREKDQQSLVLFISQEDSSEATLDTPSSSNE
jgi:hypothetical protein